MIVEERNRSIRTILRSVAQLQLGGGLIFRIGPAPNKRFPAVVICTAAQHRPHHSPFSTPRVRNMGSTWDQLWQTRPQLSAKLSPKGPPKLHYAEHDLDLHVHHMASSSAHLDQTLGPTSAQHNSNLGSSWVQHSATWAQALFADSMRHAENVRFDCYFQRFLASVGVRATPCSPHWACLGPSFGGRLPPCRTQLRRLSPTCGPSWLEPIGQSSVQVTPKLGPSRLVFGPT